MVRKDYRMLKSISPINLDDIIPEKFSWGEIQCM